ncbi:alternative ribosome rescue aminoacyl-tRNA hydrolase ArfB [Streptomyces sedi]|uniref:Aminoacyl-tRNA hydrolase n=1 Tax=Streptomyces sedi TaxID=555059 RepID=A0A5C4UNA1_9ACTN|nr:alternative ribosome rescue aminoacyl-tRNA hydrolase ArfB [Streptomyces sedi]TNM25097.1 aminoacyl-tRNA hydrolase [Streptomyces sedi]
MERMSGPYPIRGAVHVPESELRWRFSRSSGPGGQHVNTSDTQAELRFDLAATTALPEVWKERALERLSGRLTDGGVLVVRASEHRSQWRNREAAARRLAELLAEATAPPARPRRPKKKPRALVERRLREKRRRSDVKKGRSGRAGWD